MHRLRRLLPGLVCLVPLLACGPIGPLPGGGLSGTVVPPPPNWAFTDAVENFQLETRPDDPYSVNVWGVAYDGGFYVAAGGGAESTWVLHLDADPRLRLRVDNRLYELVAARVSDVSVRDQVTQALVHKYDFQPDPDDVKKSLLFRLAPRKP